MEPQATAQGVTWAQVAFVVIPLLLTTVASMFKAWLEMKKGVVAEKKNAILIDGIEKHGSKTLKGRVHDNAKKMGLDADMKRDVDRVTKGAK